MIYAFVFALVLGGVLLGASLLVGDGHGEIDGGDGIHVSGDGVDAIVGTMRSLRFWTFFLAFFGLTGIALQTLGVIDSGVIAGVFATLMGGVVGYGATWAFRVLDRRESNSVTSEDDLIGKTGRVLVPVTPGGLGKLRVQAKGTTVDLLAKADDESFAVDEEAIVIEVENAFVKVARVDDATGARKSGGE